MILGVLALPQENLDFVTSEMFFSITFVLQTTAPDQMYLEVKLLDMVGLRL